MSSIQIISDIGEIKNIKHHGWRWPGWLTAKLRKATRVTDPLEALTILGALPLVDHPGRIGMCLTLEPYVGSHSRHGSKLTDGKCDVMAVTLAKLLGCSVARAKPQWAPQLETSACFVFAPDDETLMACKV